MTIELNDNDSRSQACVDHSRRQWTTLIKHALSLLTMKLRFLSVTLPLACWTLAACHTTQPPVTREALVGSYTYVSKDPASRTTDHNLDHLVLRPDGAYELVEGGTTKVVSDKKGVWRVVPGNPPNVLLDLAGYPIKIKGTEVRLLVDLDVGIWWLKS